jgi:L-lactate dehydrogenase complex protein LldE
VQRSEAELEVALFVPCYIDQLYPEVGWAALEVLQAYGVTVHVPPDQTCCGQPWINTGALHAARPLAAAFAERFASQARVVCPSGSCAAALRRQLARAGAVAPQVFELCEFLVDVVGVERLSASFPHRVALHQSCHGLRELGLGAPSELGGGEPGRESPARKLLGQVEGLTLVQLERDDDCCGFGGTFCVKEAGVSTRMGEDRLADFERAGAEVVTSMDMSCLMHLSGLAQRQGRGLGFLHIAEVLAGRTPALTRTTPSQRRA